MFNRRLLVSTSGGVVVGPPATLEFDIDQPGGSSLPGATITISYNGEFIMRELTTEEFEEIEKALYKEGNRKVIATLEGD